MRRIVWPPRYGRPGQGVELLPSVLLAVLMLGALVFWANRQLRPVLRALAVSEISSAVTGAVNDAVAASLAEEAVSYDDMVHIETDENGRAAVLKSDMVRVNQLRTRLLSAALEEVAGLSVRDFSIPMGNLLGLDFLSGRGPKIKVEVLSAGTASADFQNEFSAAGVNQTLHRIMLELDVTVQILLPGESLEAVVPTRVCVAETVIVGQVPETYLQLERGA